MECTTQHAAQLCVVVRARPDSLTNAQEHHRQSLASLAAERAASAAAAGAGGPPEETSQMAIAQARAVSIGHSCFGQVS